MPSNSMQLSADACSLSPGATNPYPAPTEHRLSWSHAPHPPSVASSTLFDPEGDRQWLLRAIRLTHVQSHCNPSLQLKGTQVQLPIVCWAVLTELTKEHKHDP